MLEIIQEDTGNPAGERTFDKGMENQEAKEFFLGFEGNKLRPLNKVLKTNWIWDENKNSLTIENFNPETHIDWPEKADKAYLQQRGIELNGAVALSCPSGPATRVLHAV